MRYQFIILLALSLLVSLAQSDSSQDNCPPQKQPPPAGTCRGKALIGPTSNGSCPGATSLCNNACCIYLYHTTCAKACPSCT
ncbi:hypothetical protein CROQUDRAFT_660989 [Cronartium quercuum f. sp. fusiforme G11]|uniref:ShKT domain-containing protein n=1 Tax=Cronartium quercuum f. sp. fusiforme G11 TaxID=708437 RepID=A0A9P6NCL1_9BASI|nr:hypothetical protein CROQUDRAFT_660989 [Cronartium quercuum f. sp. fusiforme G11]